MPPSDYPVATPVASRYESAARLLEQAQGAGCRDPHAAYLLALAHKRQGNLKEARQALRKVNPPDANVLLQLGILSLRENQPAQAEEEFARAWELDPTCYPVGYNLLLTRLTLGKLDEAVELIPRLGEVSPDAEEKHLLLLLHALLQSCRHQNGAPYLDPVLSEMSAAEEARLLPVVRGLGQLDTVCALLKTLAAARPRSAAVHETYVEAVLVWAQQLLTRSQWGKAQGLLLPLATDKSTPRTTQAALLNLLGVCSTLNQDFPSGERFLQAAAKVTGNDPRIVQNLALVKELQAQPDAAEGHWNRYFELLDHRVPVPEGIADYRGRLAYDGLIRLAANFADKQKWNRAVDYAQRALLLRPDDSEALDRMFHLYTQAGRPEDARKILRRMRQVRPDEPQFDLYELDLINIKSLDDIERVLNKIDQVLKRYPNEPRVEERALSLVANVIPLMGKLSDQLTDQLAKVMNQVRTLPNYQINWTAVREVLRDLKGEFQRLRRITGKCLPLVREDEHRNVIRDLRDHIDRKIEMCKSVAE